MNTMVLNAVMMVVWATIFLGRLTNDLWMTPEMRNRPDGPFSHLILPMAGVLFLWNLARFVRAWQAARPPDPTAGDTYRQQVRRKLGMDPKVTDPQFNFDEPPK